MGFGLWGYVFYSSALWVVCHRVRHHSVVSRRRRKMEMCGVDENSMISFGSAVTVGSAVSSLCTPNS